jgi:hypothetical protein
VRFYGLLDRDHAEVIEFYATRQDADRDSPRSLHGEPEWAGRFVIVIVDRPAAQPAVVSAR